MIAWEYTIAWGLYLLAGTGLCIIWWRMTRDMRLVVVRQIIRGMALVLVFTPWHSSESATDYAPATIIFVFEVIFESSDRVFGSVYALIASLCLMLVFLGARQLRKH